jgi:nicotinamide-nucleotide amidase
MVPVISGPPRPLVAETIAVGSEMLTPFRVDTNSLFVTEQLNDVGIRVRAKTVVGDDREDLAAVFRAALHRSDVIVLIGGLGPTTDDVTREVVAGVLGTPLEEHEDLVEHIRRRFRARGLAMPEINRRQALVPRGSVRLENPNGTAVGLFIEHGEHLVVLLPGPPRELKPMFEAVVRDRLTASAGRARLYRRVIKVTGQSESHVDEAAQPIYAKWADRADAVETTILAVPGQIELHLTTRDEHPERAAARLDEMTAELAIGLRPAVYSTDGRSLEEVVGEMLRSRRLRIATAESCTGGLLASRLTDVPGSSDYVERGIVCYSNRAKTEVLGVPDALIREHGAVSEPVAVAMATLVRQQAGVEVGVGITGIAGPAGGSEAKPVGTVMIALAVDTGLRVTQHQFIGHRSLIKFQAAQAALDMVRRWLLETA